MSTDERTSEVRLREAGDPIGCKCSEFPECTHVLYFYMGVKHVSILNSSQAPAVQPDAQVMERAPVVPQLNAQDRLILGDELNQCLQIIVTNAGNIRSSVHKRSETALEAQRIEKAVARAAKAVGAITNEALSVTRERDAARLVEARLSVKACKIMNARQFRNWQADRRLILERALAAGKEQP